jgi:hypothetical protein
MDKLIATLAAAALFAAIAFMTPGLNGVVEAHNAAVGKTARLDHKPFGPACAQQHWPYYEASCLRNTVGPKRDARPARLIAIDRIAARD